MAAITIFNEAGLLTLLGDELYFVTEEGGARDSNKAVGRSSDATTDAEACTLESLFDNILLEASLEFERTAKKPIIHDQVTYNTLLAFPLQNQVKMLLWLSLVVY